MDRKEIIEKVTDKAEDLGWSVYAEHIQECDQTQFEFSKLTPAGKDFSILGVMEGRSLESLMSSLHEYYEGFDVDAETYLWLDKSGHGMGGAPYRMRDVLDDMEAAAKMMHRLILELDGLNEKTARDNN